MKLNFKKECELDGFYLPGDRVTYKGLGQHLILRLNKDGVALTTPFRWWHWMTRWFL